jgi:hypothetical protein
MRHEELASAKPQLAVAIGHQRQRIDEDRIGSGELHVVGAGIAQREAELQREQMQVEVKQRRALQKFERPLIGIADKTDRLVFEHAAREIAERRFRRDVGRHQPLPRKQLCQQTGGFQLLKRSKRVLAQHAKHPAVVMGNVTGGIAKRSLVTHDRHQPSTLYCLNQACIFAQPSSAASLR